MGTSFSIEKDGDVLIYTTYGHGYSLETTEKLKPTPKEWVGFWETCEQIDVWEWHPRYENPEVMDGYSWRFFVEFENETFDSSGSNNGPEGLEDFFKAVGVLLRGAVFY